mgnify:CR=1 FL=1
MHTLRLTLVLTCLIGACSTTDSGTTAGTTTSGETQVEASTTGTDGPTTSAAPTETGSETSSVTTTGDAETAAHEHTETTEPHGTSGTTGEDSPVDAYCLCMLEICHDQYHALWGEDHRESEAMCRAYAEGVPSVGMPAMSGDSIECRLHFCTLGEDDPGPCESALGAAPCE